MGQMPKVTRGSDLRMPPRQSSFGQWPVIATRAIAATHRMRVRPVRTDIGSRIVAAQHE